MPTNFIVNAADLTYILRQIKIAENTSIGYTPGVAPVSIMQAIMNEYGVNAANAGQLPAGLRTVDGTFNNLLIAPTLKLDPVTGLQVIDIATGLPAYSAPGTSELAAADTLFPRLTDPAFLNVDGPGIDFNGDGIYDVINHNYGDASTAPGYQIKSVADSDPRTITNLIVDMSVNNPAAISTFLNNPLSLDAFEAAHPGKTPVAPGDPLLVGPNSGSYLAITNADLQTIPNQSPDIGLSPGFNSWMTFFGQFFDHGLDLVTKGSNGTVYIPLFADDPLYDKGKDGLANNIVNVYFVSDPALASTLPATSTAPTAWQAFYATDPADRSLYAPGAFAPAVTATNTSFAVKFNDDGFGADGLVGTLDDRPNFMALTRATATMVDPDGAGPLPAVPQHENTTTSWIDQNQTYTSHASHQVFLREYAKDAAGHAVSTGRLIDGTTASGSVAGAVGNWGEVKAQAKTMLGIILNDFDVNGGPLLLTDQYGKFIPGANGYAQLVMAPDALHATNWLKEGTALGITTAGSIGTGHAFLNDIAHHAAPGKYDDDNNPATPKVNQTADLDIQDVNNDGKIDAIDILANNRDVNRDGVVNAADLVADDGVAGTYDDEMLNAHFITGDGRGNENIALTTVHSIFHSEHNRLVEANKATLLEAGQSGTAEGLALLNEYLLVDVAVAPSSMAGLVWDGERLFQAARFGTEMQYQHLVFEEFARRIQPMVNPFVFQNSPNIDPSIVAEFAHTVYRFGHSMLTGTVDRLTNDLATVDGLDQKTLLAVFLNPQAYIGSGADLATINANIIRGLSRDVGNAMDEFIVTDVRSNLLGLPLDLGALNIARGRDTGIPSLNQTRAQLYNDTGLADLKPYVSWVDFASHITNAASIVNFIAAYGTHSTITSETTMAGKRAAAEKLVFASTSSPSDRLDFINATGAYAPDGAGPNDDSRGGLELIDLWIGGLAEAHPEFGGMLGTTFNYVFEAQMEKLQDGDRLYYLSRTQGQNFVNQLEPNTFADLVMRNTALGDQYATHVNGFLFVTPDHILELDRGIAQEDYNGSASGLDPTWAPGERHSLFAEKVARTYSGFTDVVGVGANAVSHDFGATLRFMGGEHVVVGGTEGNDSIWTDRGIDTLWGDGGDDYLNAGTESDNVFGGDGDDIIEDPFGDDLLRGNAGNDVINNARGAGADILFGNEGMDVLFGGQDAMEAFGGTDTDFILGSSGTDGLLGNEGDDWIEGGNGLDVLSGDNSDIFFNSLIIGNDVLFGQGDENDLDAESGDDIMGSGPSIFRYEGMFGFDYVIGKGDLTGVDFDMRLGLAPITDPAAVLRDRFDHVESISGYLFDDILTGDDRGHVIPGTVVTGTTADPLFVNDILKQSGINLIDGLEAWFGGARQTLFGTTALNPIALVAGSEGVTSYRDGNIIMGGDGNDTLKGQGGYDLLDGDAYLNVRIGIMLGIGANVKYYSAESLNTDKSQAGPNAGLVYAMVGNNPQGEVDFTSPAFGGRSLQSLLLDRTINPAQMSIVREIKYDSTNLTGASQNFDTAVYNGTLAEYDIEGRTVDADGFELTKASDVNGDGWITVHDRDNGLTGATVNGVTLVSRGLRFVDDTDLIKNIEELKFKDQTLVLSGPHLPKPPALDLHAFNVVTTTTNYRDTFTTSAFNNSDGLTPWTTPWVETNDGANAVGAGQIQIVNQLRFNGGINTTTFNGAEISRAVNLSGLASTTLSYDFTFALIDPGETLTVQFAPDGVTFNTIQTISGGLATDANGAGSFSIGLTGPFTSNATLKFLTSAINAAGENFRIDNVNFNTTTSANVPVVDGTGFTSTFTEDGAAAPIASNAAITDPDSTNMVGAKIRLTNAQSLDILSIAGALPVGIISSFGAIVAGEITLILSGAASLADYQTAIQAVRYSTTSQNPSVTPRVFEVTVRDSSASSPVAIATVNIVPVNDAPVAVADTILTNVSDGSAFVVPEWALLANDTDPENNVLTVTAVSAPVGVTGLSLATNPGSVTLSDGTTPGGSFTYTASDGALTSNAKVTVTNQSATNVADNFNGAGAVRSAANNSTGAVAWTTSWIEADDDGNILAGQVQIDSGGGNGSNNLRFLGSAAANGASISRVVNLAGATGASLTFSFVKAGVDLGESVQVQFAADGVNFTTLQTLDNTGALSGTIAPLALTGALGATSAIRLVGSAMNAGTSIAIDNLRIDYASPNATITGTANGEILVGNDAGSILNALGGNDRIFAGGGDDTVNAGAGDDIIYQVAATGGRDFIDGGVAGVDRVIIQGDSSNEAYLVYARAALPAALLAGLNAATEIVITRNGVVISELVNVEEITINTNGGVAAGGGGLAAGVDSVAAVGNFNPTSLAFNTITVNGGPGTTIDASRLTSAHKLVLNPDGTISDVQVALSADEEFDGIGQSMIDQLAHDGLLDRLDDGHAFIGSRQHGMFAAALFATSDHDVLHFNPMFDRELAMDLGESDFGHGRRSEHHALHFDAADHLIS